MTTQKYILLSLFVALLYFLPVLILQQNSYVLIPDNLDGEFVNIKTLAESNHTFSRSGTLSNIMEGLPRSAMRSGYNVVVGLFSIFPPFWAYWINSMLIHVLGFFGMWLLLKEHIFKEEHLEVAIILALCFSLLPFYTIFGFSVAGMPLVFWAFMNLLKDQKKWSAYLILLLFPFYSFVGHAGVFLILFFMVFGIWKWFQNQKLQVSFWLGMILLGVAYIISDFSLVSNFLSENNFVSHRTDMDRSNSNWMQAIKSSVVVFLKGHYHAANFIAIPALLLIVVSWYLKFKVSWFRKWEVRFFIFLGVVAFLHGFYGIIVSIFGNQIAVFNYFLLDRFTFLIPTVLFLVTGFATNSLIEKFSLKMFVIPILLLQLILILFSNKEWTMNMKQLVGIEISEPTYHQFFDQPLFKQMEKIIPENKSEFKTVSIGINPAIPMYHGFQTLDSYQSNYDLNFKHEFRNIIAKELNKDESLKRYFDKWGNECYVFSEELWGQCYTNCWKGSTPKLIRHLDINTDILRDKNVQYIFSAVEIENASDLGLELKKVFSEEDSVWRIYLYAVYLSKGAQELK